MMHNTCNKLISDFGEAKLIGRIIKSIGAVVEFEKAHIGVHTGAVNTVNRLRHKGCMQAVLCGICFNNMLKGHNSVGRGHNIVKSEIDFMLRFGNLVVYERSCRSRRS